MIKQTKDPIFEKWYKVKEYDFSGFEELKKNKHFEPKKEKESSCRCMTTVKQLQTL